jgi:AraC family transcriptional regulator
MGRLYVESLANALVVNLLQDHSATYPRIAQYEDGLGDRKLLQITRYIDNALDQDIKLADLAQLAEMSQSYFSRYSNNRWDYRLTSIYCNNGSNGQSSY